MEEATLSKMRTLRARVEENSVVIESIVAHLVRKYNSELEDTISRLRDSLQDPQALSDEDLEAATLKIPLYLYFAAGGLESLGTEGDTAKAAKLEAFNKAYQAVEGTIADKTAYAENLTFPEYLVEIAFIRAYKKLKLQIEMAVNLSAAVKKVLSKRMEDNQARRNNGQAFNNRRDDD